MDGINVIGSCCCCYYYELTLLPGKYNMFLMKTSRTNSENHLLQILLQSVQGLTSHKLNLQALVDLFRHVFL